MLSPSIPSSHEIDTVVLTLSFIVVSRAFQVLSDPDKKAKYDRFGGDPDSRFTPSAGPSGGSSFSSSGFSGGFPRSHPAAGGTMFEEEISPEELFNRFFGGSFGPMSGGFSPFGRGPSLSSTCGGSFTKLMAVQAVVRSLSSIWEAGQAFECIHSAAIGHAGDQRKRRTNRRRRPLAGPRSRSFFPLSFSSSCRSSLRYFLAAHQYPLARLSASMAPSPPTPCIALRQS